MSRPPEQPARRGGRRGDPLSPRERQMLALIAAGKRTRDIADEIGISSNTVKSHLSRVYRKIGARNRVEAARYHLEREDGTTVAPTGAARTDPSSSLDQETSSLIRRQIREIEARLDELADVVIEADRLQRALAALRAIEAERDDGSG